jgi:beta-lactamase regulating signal transducer with metallopeptidase domain
METLFTFLLNASAGVVLFYAVYWLFLRKETYYNANRFFLLLALVTSVLLPQFPIQYSVFVEQGNLTTTIKSITDTFQNIPIFIEAETEVTNFNWQQAILFVYLTGAAIFLMRLLIQSFILFVLIVKNRVKLFNDIRIVENEKYGLPFSFFNVVFINPKFHKQEDLPEILAHEKVHIRENHWFDLLLIELLTVIFWFNPFIWFFERSIKQNHEYLADKGVLLQGHNTGRYQAILLNQLMGMQIIGLTNNLNFALNTNRLKMMTKKKTPKIKWAKFVWTLPVLALLLFAFAKPSYRVKETDVVGKDILIREAVGEKTVKMVGIVLDENGDPLPGTSVVVKGTSNGTVVDRDGTFNLELPENADIVMTFVGKRNVRDTYQGITSGDKKDGVYHRKYTMKDAVFVIDTEIPASPPPQRKGKTATIVPPPPPPPPVSLDGEKEDFYIVEIMPQYQGGQGELGLYVNKMQKKISAQKKVTGKAKVQFTVDGKGKVTNIKIVEKDNDGAAKGAYLIAKSMEVWKPGKQRGKGVPVKFLLPVEFK